MAENRTKEIAWYIMEDWLKNYSYRISIQWWVFAGAGLGSILLSVITIGYQAIRAGLVNPVRSLRSE